MPSPSRGARRERPWLDAASIQGLLRVHPRSTFYAPILTSPRRGLAAALSSPHSRAPSRGLRAGLFCAVADLELCRLRRTSDSTPVVLSCYFTRTGSVLFRYPLDPGSSKPEGGGPFDWRSAQHARSEEPKPWISVKEALEGLPEATPHAASPVANHFPIDGARSYPRHLPSVMHLPAKTVKAGVHGVAGGENTVSVAGGGVRYFTLRELARLQTFPDSYEFLGPRSSIVRQIGNAVCCALAEELAAGALALIEQHYSAGKRRAI